MYVFCCKFSVHTDKGKMQTTSETDREVQIDFDSVCGEREQDGEGGGKVRQPVKCYD